jgi:hypothetical protein
MPNRRMRGGKKAQATRKMEKEQHCSRGEQRVRSTYKKKKDSLKALLRLS